LPRGAKAHAVKRSIGKEQKQAVVCGAGHW
jgi:hypothetical protein